MNLLFGSAKDNNQTISVDNHYIHSPYSPIKEAERFVSLLPSDSEYDVIILIEPGLSYTYNYLKQKYPGTTIGIIRLISELSDSNASWDFIFNFDNSENLKNQLLSYFSEEKLLCSLLTEWVPSKNIFPDEVKQIWHIYKEILEQSRTILITRQYFEKKWIINTCNYIKYFTNNNFAYIQKTSKPIIIVSSGPSLNKVIKQIPDFREKCYLICLSSAIKVLISNNIIPDLILTTDGGYYAGQHLKQLYQTSNIPLAVPSEAFIQKSLLEKLQIIPCAYSDGVSKKLLEVCNIKPILLERNGTVSGTALKLALSLTTSDIFCLGMDLAPNQSKQHSEPNELEINNCLKDFRLNNKETRQTRSRFNSGSLLIYRNWFKSLSGLQNKVYRVIENQDSIGEIKNINYLDFITHMMSVKVNSNVSSNKNDVISQCIKYSKNEKEQRIKKLKTFISEYSLSEDWKKQIFPVDYISIKHANNLNEKEMLLKNLEDKNEKLLNKIRKLLEL